jgi:hypothetical protein
MFLSKKRGPEKRCARPSRRSNQQARCKFITAHCLVNSSPRGNGKPINDLYLPWQVPSVRQRHEVAASLVRPWSGKRVSNPQPSAWKADALPIELFPLLLRLAGEEPVKLHAVASQPDTGFSLAEGPIQLEGGSAQHGGGGRIRTSEGCADRFTVCSLWPLGNPSINSVNSIVLHTPKCRCKYKDNVAKLELAMGLEPATC